MSRTLGSEGARMVARIGRTKHSLLADAHRGERRPVKTGTVGLHRTAQFEDWISGRTREVVALLPVY